MDISKILLDILNSTEEFPQKDKQDVEEFIEHDEWGIALETICSVILEERININKQLYEQIDIVGNEMQMNSMLWNGISKLVKL